jgi:hypothetical protein
MNMMRGGSDMPLSCSFEGSCKFVAATMLSGFIRHPSVEV